VLCDSAFFDQQDRLCLIGVVRRLNLQSVPHVIRQLTLVARLVDIQPVDEITIAVGMVTPSGFHASSPGAPEVMIEMAGEYVLASIRDVLLIEEGVHHFRIMLVGQVAVDLEIPVLAAGKEASATLQ
jgi:hypothetical protein